MLHVVLSSHTEGDSAHSMLLVAGVGEGHGLS